MPSSPERVRKRGTTPAKGSCPLRSYPPPLSRAGHDQPFSHGALHGPYPENQETSQVDEPERLEPVWHTRPQRHSDRPARCPRTHSQTTRSNLPRAHRVPHSPPLMARLWKVCSRRDCPELVPPGGHCPKHPPPDRNQQTWSPTRDQASHKRLRRQIVKERPNKCERCGKPFGPNARGAALHHLRKGDRPENVILVCHSCHAAIDSRARVPK